MYKKLKSKIRYSGIRTNLGWIYYTHDGTKVTSIHFGKDAVSFKKQILKDKNKQIFFESKHKKVERELKEYLSGRRKVFKTEVKLQNLGEFTKNVLNELKKVAYGRTVSYKNLAIKISRPSAARAVGQAVGSNPCPILIPCHRVIRSDGSLGGFSGGLSFKKELLKIEGFSFLYSGNL